MSASYGFSNGDPGWTASLETAERNIYWGSDPTKKVEQQTVTLAAATVDSTNTPTTLLRPGLILGKIAATGFFTHYSPTATDGSQQAIAILREEINMFDPGTSAVATRVVSAVISGPVKASACPNIDNIARKQLTAGGILWDDDRLTGADVLYAKAEVSKAADYTVLATDDGTMFIATAAVNFTLPALARGLSFTFFQDADANMVITSAAGNDIIADGDLAASTLTFSTASHKIGSCVKVTCNAAGTKWRAFVLSGPGNVVTIA